MRCDQLLKKFPVTSSTTRTWETQMLSLSENWEGCRQKLFETVLKQERSPVLDKCNSCNSSSAIIRCYDCNMLYCSSCDENFHQGHPFHDREAFVDGFFQPIPPTCVVDESGFFKTVCES